VISLAEIGVEDTTAWRRGSSGRDCVYLGGVTRTLIDTSGPQERVTTSERFGRSGKLSWCSNGLTGAEVQVRLAMGVRGGIF